MTQRTRAQRLNGLFPLSYMGVVPVSPVNFVIDDRPPTINDSKNFYIGDLWLDNGTNTPPTNEDLYMLVSLVGNNATWVNFGGGDLETLTGNTGGPVSPDGADNINVVGDAVGVTVTGTPATNTLTISLIGGGTAAQSFPTDFLGPAVPNGSGELNIFGGASIDAEQVALVYRQNIHTSGAGNTVSVKLNDSISLPETTTDGLAGVLYLNGVADTDRFLHAYSTFGLTIAGNTFLGIGSGNFNTTSVRSTAVGRNALANVVGGGGNSAFGADCLSSLNAGENNSSAGFASLTALSSGSRNSTLGYRTGLLNNGNNNVFIGADAASDYSGTESNNIVIGYNNTGLVGETNIIRMGTYGQAHGDDNIFIGPDAGNNTYTAATAINNVFIGSNVGSLITTAANCTAVGAGSLQVAQSSERTTALGSGAGSGNEGSDNTLIGYNTLNLNAGAGTAQNTIIGSGAMSGNANSVNNNIAIGYQAGINYQSNESYNIVIGNTGLLSESGIVRVGVYENNALNNNRNTFIGWNAGNTTYTLNLGALEGISNTCIGYNAGNSLTVANTSTFVGANAGGSVTEGISNSAFGSAALNSATDQEACSAFGQGALGANNGGIGHNSAFGYGCLARLTSGERNSAIGYDAGVGGGGGLLTGSHNCLFGTAAASTFAAAESSNIIINSLGVVGDNNTLRIGNATGSGDRELNRAFIQGIAGVAVSNALNVVIDSTTGQLGTESSTSDVFAYTNVNTSPYVVLSTDEFLGVDCSGGPITIQLPDAPPTGRLFVIKDRTGNANTNNITVTTVGGVVLIDGATSYTMNTQYSSVSVLFGSSTYQIW